MALIDLKINRDPKTEIWRYVRLNGFLELLTGRITFTRADQFEDKNEGGYGWDQVRVADRVFDYLGLSHTRKVHLDPNLDYEVRRGAHEAIYPARKRTYITCWVQQQIESYAMWYIYGRPHESVALVSTVGRLASAIRTGMWNLDVEAHIGLVAYQKPQGPIEHISEFFLHKRPHFEFEREVR